MFCLLPDMVQIRKYICGEWWKGTNSNWLHNDWYCLHSPISLQLIMMGHSYGSKLKYFYLNLTTYSAIWSAVNNPALVIKIWCLHNCHIPGSSSKSHRNANRKSISNCLASSVEGKQEMKVKGSVQCRLTLTDQQSIFFSFLYGIST